MIKLMELNLLVTDIDPETGAISWSVDYVPNLDKLVEDVNGIS